MEYKEDDKIMITYMKGKNKGQIKGKGKGKKETMITTKDTTRAMANNGPMDTTTKVERKDRRP
eukprot:6365749-Amphidinium_carterae.1